jgi:ABC-type uncharacterized transport system substrate-binding protein
VQLVNLATRHEIPAIFPNRESTEIGRLMSYASNIADVWRQAGVYAGRILNGAKPADLPVVQSSKFELVINHQNRRRVWQLLIEIADPIRRAPTIGRPWLWRPRDTEKPILMCHAS